MDKALLITIERLKVVLSYDPKTGYFTWLNPASAHIKTGQRAGTVGVLGYVHITISRRIYLGHRLAWFYMTGEWPSDEIDHKDLNKSNNAWSNLREATHAENLHNRRASKNNKSGYKGVWWHPKAGKWQAQICTNRTRTYLGLFSRAEDASAAYKAAAERLHGEFSRHS